MNNLKNLCNSTIIQSVNENVSTKTLLTNSKTPTVAILLGFFVSARFNVYSMSSASLNMKFKCVFTNKRTNKKINKDFTVKEIDNYLGEYIKDRAIKRGETTTTVIKRGDSWKVLIEYIK